MTDCVVPTILYVAASPRQERSRSRRLAERVIKRALERMGAARLISHDVGLTPPPPVDEAWIAANAAGSGHALHHSDRLVADLKRATHVLISTPMYNWGVPAGLKAWIDQVVREGHTFAYDDGYPESPYQPLLKDLPTLVIVSGGSPGNGRHGPLWSMNSLEPQLATVLKVIGPQSPAFVYTTDGGTVEADGVNMLDRWVPPVAADQAA